MYLKENGQKAKYSVNCKLNKPKLSQIENALNDNDTSPMMKLSSLLQWISLISLDETMPKLHMTDSSILSLENELVSLQSDIIVCLD